VDGRLQALDKSLQPNHETGSAAALTRDRAFEVQVLGQDLGQPPSAYVARFFADAEALYSYEGTREMNTLIVGKAITGFSAFV